MTTRATNVTGHTPTPWNVGELDRNGQRIIRNNDLEIATLWHHSVVEIAEQMEANAEFICRAVNSHDQLVEALDWSMAVLDGYDPPLDKEPHRKFHAGIEAARAALRLARGER
jgi:hypothetical protein